MLNVIEIFESIQGETTFAGLPTVFIRLAACNLRCTWCDTPYSFGRGESFSLDEIMQSATKYQASHTCMTGGEPLLQKNVLPLMSMLCDIEKTVSLETGGSLPTDKVDPRVHVILDIKCPGSGMSKKNLWTNICFLRPEKDEVKFVLLDRADYDWMKEVYLKYDLNKRTRAVLLSPVFGKLDPQTLVKWMLADGIQARLNLQIHKIIWSPETRGV